MKRSRLLCLLLAVAVAVGIASSRWRNSGSFTHDPSPKEHTALLYVSAESLNLGPVWESDEYVWTAAIENRETEPLQIISIDKACYCLSVEPQSFILNPGQRQQLRMKLDLTRSESEIKVQLRAKVRVVTTDETLWGPEWQLNGRVEKALIVDRFVSLGTYSELAESIPQQTIPIEILVPLKSLSADCNLAGARTSVELPPTGIGKSVVRIDMANRLPKGRFEGSVILKSRLQTGEALPDRRINVTLAIVTDITAEPPEIQVGGRRIGEVLEETVTLRSASGNAFGVLKTEAEGDGLVIEPLGSRNRYCIRQTAVRTGEITTHAKFIVDVGGTMTTARIPIRYRGIERE